jgi:tetratricopeptide (TPR) repeat protein
MRIASNRTQAARGRRLWALTAGLAGSLLAGSGRAGPIQDAHRKLSELEERARALSSSFRESYAPDPNAADRRVIEAEKLFAIKNYGAAATLCLDVIERYPQSRAFDDATFLLAESLFKDGDLLSARRYFEQAAKKGILGKREQRALQRIIEISLRSGDFSGVEDHLNRLEQIKPVDLDPAVPYVRGKYYYFRDRPNEAMTAFESVAPGQPYYLQSRYFVATLQVKKNDFASAARSFDDVLKLQPRDEGEKDIQDLARLAIGRLLYDRGQFDRAKQWYSSVPRQSKYFGDAMYESAWNSIKSGDFRSAYRALDLMVLQDPASARVPELRLLIGNLHLRLANFYLASSQFTSTLGDYEPIYKELLARQEQAKSDPKFYERLVSQGIDKFDIGTVIPKAAVKLVAREPDVAKLLVLAEDVGTLQRGIRESERLVQHLEQAVGSGHIVGMFPDLASARSRSSEIINQSIEVRRRFQAEARALAARYLTPADRASLDGIAGERAVLEQELRTLPLTQDKMRSRATAVRDSFATVDARASEVNVLIQSLEAEVVAIEQYFIHDRAERRVNPGMLQQQLDPVKEEIKQTRAVLDKVRNEIAVAGQEATLAGASGSSDRSASNRLVELLQREREILARARPPGGEPDANSLQELMGVLQRSDAVQTHVLEFDGRLDGIADRRLGDVKSLISTEKTNLEAAGGKLTSVLSESQSVGGGLAEAMLLRATSRFYDLTVQSDVGLIDVSWGIKDSKTQNVSKLINQQKLELQAVEDDFQPLLREDDK